MITRRRLLTQAAAAAATGLSARMAWAQTTLTLGTLRIDTLSDGSLVLPRAMLFGDTLPEAELAATLDRYGITGDTVTPDCNITLVRDGTRVILIDTGAGQEFMPSAGRLPDALTAVGVAPSEVTHVIFTHAHPDHLWGVLDDFGDPLFANATYLIGQVEWDYWTDPATVDTIGEARAAFAVGAKRRLEMLGDTIQLFRDGEEILPDIAARASFGHTPGHMALQIGAGADSVMVLGDSIANHHVAFEQPQWHSGADQDADQAAATRRLLLDQIAAAQMHLIGFHLPYPGIGRAEKRGSGYVFVSAT